MTLTTRTSSRWSLKLGSLRTRRGIQCVTTVDLKVESSGVAGWSLRGEIGLPEDLGDAITVYENYLVAIAWPCHRAARLQRGFLAVPAGTRSSVATAEAQHRALVGSACELQASWRRCPHRRHHHGRLATDSCYTP